MAGEPEQHVRFDCADISLSENQVSQTNVNQPAENIGRKYGEPIEAGVISEPLSICRSREVREASHLLVVHVILKSLSDHVHVPTLLA